MDFDFVILDPAAGIDPASIRVIAHRGTMNGGSDEDLVPLYDVTLRDSTGLIMEETFPRLLHAGKNALEVSVTDLRGNRAVTALTVELPAGAYHRSIGLESGSAGDVLVLPDGSKGYFSGSGAITIFDPDSMRVTGAIAVPGASWLGNLAYDGTREELYVAENPGFAPAIFVLDARTDAVLERVALSFDDVYGLAVSQRMSELFAGLERRSEGEAFIGVLDTQQRREVAVFDLQQRGLATPGRLALDESQDKLYVGTSGLLVMDARTGRLVKRIALRPGAPDSLGFANDLGLFEDRLYLTHSGYQVARLVALETSNEDIVGELDLSGETAALRSLAVSPSGRRIFLTGLGGFDFDNENFLVDAFTFQVLERFGPPTVNGSYGVAFHPDGTRVFVGDGFDLDVFINRE